MRFPQPVASSGIRLRSARTNSLAVLRPLRARRLKTATGDKTNAQVMGEERAPEFDAVVLGVAMVKVNVFDVEAGGTMGGLNEAFARLGSPVAARVMGLDMLP